MTSRSTHRGGRLAALVLGVTLPTLAIAGSVGSPSNGSLVDGFRLPLTHAHYRFAGPVHSRSTQWMTLEMAALVVRAAQVVQRETGDATLTVGDASAEHGGALARHLSHRSGRDIDILFYALDGAGDSVTPHGFIPYGDDGHARAGHRALRFDDARNWWLVRTLVSSQHPAVMWIFVAPGLKRRLLGWARQHGEHPEVLRRASQILHCPQDAGRHDDHFHVRIYCSPDDRAGGCDDGGPTWAWVDGDGQARPILPLTRP